MSAYFPGEDYSIMGWSGPRFGHADVEEAYVDHVASENATTRNRLKYVLVTLFIVSACIQTWFFVTLEDRSIPSLDQFQTRNASTNTIFRHFLYGCGVIAVWKVPARYLEHSVAVLQVLILAFVLFANSFRLYHKLGLAIAATEYDLVWSKE